MSGLRRKFNPRRKQFKDNMPVERFGRLSEVINSGIPVSSLLLLSFAVAAAALLAIDTSNEQLRLKPWFEIAATAVITLFVCIGAGLYIYYYENRIVKTYIRGLALGGMFIILLAMAKLGSLFPRWGYLATGTAVTSAVVLTITYNQRFAFGLSLFYAVLACFAVEKMASLEVFLTMTAGIVSCCFFLKEIRTRTKLLEVSTVSAVIVFITAFCTGLIQGYPKTMLFYNAGSAAGVTIAVGMVLQAILPLIEKIFRIATSMTLLDYSDANQPLLRRLAMEAPGTFSHSLLLGSIAESAAESIGANGLLCRVGAYYHDIGKINKPRYFVENQMSSRSWHQQLSPAMSQLIIVGHVKDGIELAMEYGLPAVLRQFIETHHGTTLIEYFYNEARKKTGEREAAPMESEFRYPGPKPQTKEAAIVMLTDAVEGAVRSLPEITPMRIEAVVHNMAMKRLQDGQFDESELTLRELSRIETSLSKNLVAHYHGRIAYPTAPDQPVQNIAQ